MSFPLDAEFHRPHLFLVRVFLREGPWGRFHTVFEGNVKPKRQEIDKIFSKTPSMTQIEPEKIEKQHSLAQK
jgi:hypothetical protein